MSKRKYKRGAQIKTIAEFDQCESKWFVIRYPDHDKTLHRSFIISWQYRTLLGFINRGMLYKADDIKEEI